MDSLHLDPAPAWVRCLGKGAKERTLPVHERAAKALARYLDSARPALLKNRPQGALFVNRRGERLTRQGFWLILKGYAEDMGLGDLTPHMLRHSFASHMLSGGADIRSVQALLGHASHSTTQIYTQLNHAENPRHAAKAGVAIAAASADSNGLHGELSPDEVVTED